MRRAIALISVLCFCFGFVHSANFVEIGYPMDTILYYDLRYFMIAVENDDILESISIAFEIYSPDGVSWQLWDMSSSQFAPATPYGGNFITGVEGSRWMSGVAEDGSCWDLGGTLVNDSLAPGQFLVGGAASIGGLQPGPLEHMLDIHFIVTAMPEGFRILCIDSAFYPPAGQFVFDPGGTPATNLPLCLPVTDIIVCPFWDLGLPTGMEILHCETGQVTLSATSPYGDDVKYYIFQVTGNGTADVGLYSGIVTYDPAPSDAGQNINILVEATRRHYAQGTCVGNLWVLDVTVTNTPPSIDCGSAFNYAAPPNVLIKQDITASDPDACENLTYSVISVVPTPVGSFDIDPMTAEFTFQPDAADGMMSFTFQIEVTDDVTSAAGEFMVDVIGQESVIGDPDVDGETNVADSVMIINYIFKGGPAPDIMNSADVNADCVVNVADAVYIIQYVFHGGPEPQMGCVF